MGINFSVSVLDVSAYSISVNVMLGNKSWVCTGVYASPIPSLRAPFWNYLCTLGNSINNPWVLIGDFNEILLPGDQRGGLFSTVRAKAFAQVLDRCNLVDLNTLGGQFTWHRNNRGNRSIAKKLD